MNPETRNKWKLGFLTLTIILLVGGIIVEVLLAIKLVINYITYNSFLGRKIQQCKNH